MNHFGFLAINKPTGISSRKALDAVKKIVRPTKVGHTGTLDPLASGVLVVCVGPATRLASFVQQLPKTYIGEFQLGVKSVSDDTETELSPLPSPKLISAEDLVAAIPEFVGEIPQVPPDFSAVKVQGKRAYKLSRAGQTVSFRPRKVLIHSIELLNFEYPNFQLRVQCGSGTYVRSLGRDLGVLLGSAAVMTSLVRTAVGQFTLEDAIAVDQLDAQSLSQCMVPPNSLFDMTTWKTLNSMQIKKLQNGYLFPADELAADGQTEFVTAVDEQGNLLAIFTPHSEGTFKPKLNFVHFYQDNN